MKKRYVGIPFIIWLILFLIFIVFLPRIIKGEFIKWYWMLLWAFILFLIVGSFIVVIYYYFGIFNIEKKKNAKVEKVVEVEPKLIRNHIIHEFLITDINPINLIPAKFSFAGIRSIGTEEKTEIYIDKFADNAYGSYRIYYIGVRVRDLTKMFYETRDYQPDPIEEEALVQKICNNLATSPEQKVTKEMRIIQNDGTERVTIERTPYHPGMFQQNKKEEPGDEM